MNDVVPFTRFQQPAPVERPLPFNIDAEQALIGAVLVNNQAWHVVSGTGIVPEHFVDENHRRIWEVASTLIRDGKVANSITLRTWLGDHDLGAGLTVPMYLAQLARDATTVINAPDYAEMVVNLAVRRTVITANQEANEIAFDAPVSLSVPKLIDDAIERLRAVSEAMPQVESRETIDGAVSRLLDRARDRLEGKVEEVPHTGMPEFDKRLRGGLRPSRLIVLAGRPGMGKTAVATALARRAAQRGFGVACFNLEIDCEETGSRLISNMLAHTSHRVPYGQIVDANLNPDEIEAVAEEQRRLRSFPIEVDERAGLTMAQIETRALQAGKRFARMGRRLDVVIIDYLQLVRVTDRYKGKTVEEINEVVLAAKNMAKRHRICVVLLSQLNRDVERRDDKRPLVSDLRGSGNIEEHADAIGLLYRPNFYDRKDPKMRAEDPEFVEMANKRAMHLEIDFDKNRLGPRGSDTYYCDVGHCLVDSLSRYGDGR